MSFKKPELNVHNKSTGPNFGRKGAPDSKGVDSDRPSGLSYHQSIEANKFLESLRVSGTSEKEAIEKLNQNSKIVEENVREEDL